MTEEQETEEPQEEQSEDETEKSQEQQSEDETEKAKEEIKQLEEEGPPDKLEDWPTGKAKYETFGGPEGEHPYHEGPEQQLGPADTRHTEDGSVEVEGEEVDDPDELKGDPIPGGPTDPDTPNLRMDKASPAESSQSDEDDSESDDDDSESDGDDSESGEGDSESGEGDSESAKEASGGDREE
jgi:hypothetical protein